MWSACELSFNPTIVDGQLVRGEDWNLYQGNCVHFFVNFCLLKKCVKYMVSNVKYIIVYLLCHSMK